MIKNRQGVLGLDTARAVMVTFLVLAVTAVAVLLSLTALDDSVGNTIDHETNTVVNETGGYINSTGYTLQGAVTTNYVSGTFVISEARDGSDGSVILAGNYTVSADGVVTNTTVLNWTDVHFDYTNDYDTQRSQNIVGNVSGGLETFFGSTGTIFSILIVVVIILAISIIIWAVGRFGNRLDRETANL